VNRKWKRGCPSRLLEAIRKSGVRCRLYQTSSSEMCGDVPAPRNEQSPFQYASLDWRDSVAEDPRYLRQTAALRGLGG
jgi:nucleoside-diphosphate-sugar epimerase